MATPDMAISTRAAVAIHFVSTYRSHLTDYTTRGLPLTDQPVIVESYPARCIGPLDQFASDVRARFR